MNGLVRGYAAAVFETAEAGGRLEQVRQGLVAISRAVVASDELRLALVDPLVAVTTRRAIVRELLEGGTVGEVTALCSFTVRVERPADLPSTLAVLVVLTEAELERLRVGAAVEVEPAAGRLGVREHLRGYAERVLQELEALDEVDAVGDELFSASRVIAGNRPLRTTLSDANLAYAARAAVVDDLFGAVCEVATVRMLRYVLRAGHLRDLVGAIEWLVELAAEERGRRLAEVRTAVEIDDDERERIATALSRMVERPVEVRDVVDPSVIGGMLVRVGELVIDGTVKLRVERLRDLVEHAS